MSPEPAAPSLTLSISRTDDMAVVRCSGKLVAGVTDLLYSEVKQLIPETKRIVLDFTDLAYMDSMGIGTIVRVYVSAKGAGCNLELINLGKKIRQLLGITNLLSTFAPVGEDGIKMP